MMSAEKDIKLVCDGDNCNPTIFDGTGYFTVKEVRIAAKENGWVYKNLNDFCPDCK